jgi:putative SOS response-associated peptidase YedK
MCGRFVQYFEEVVLAKLLGLDGLDASQVFRNFKTAPTQSVAAVRLSPNALRAFPVSALVNNVRNNSEDCLQPLG